MRRTLLKEHRTAIRGTAVYYYLQHRNSIALDSFTLKDIDLAKYQNIFEPSEILLISKDTIHARVEGVNISFFYYPYPLLKPLIKFDIINLASLEGAIISRGSRNDTLIRKAMVFFEDAEKEPEIFTIKRVSWEKVKEFFVDKFVRF